MARTVKPPVQRVAAPRAPAAPPAPALNTPTGATSNQYVASQTPINDAIKNTAIRPTVPPVQGRRQTQKATNGPVEVRDAQYWNNVAALNMTYGNQVAGLNLRQAQANLDYGRETERQRTDRERARRNLAESMMGTGALRSGYHRRQQTEDDTDYMLNRSNYDMSFDNANRERALEFAGYQSEQRQGYSDAYQDAVSRYDQQRQQIAAEGEPIYKSPGINAQIKARTKRIKGLRKDLAQAESPTRKKEIRQKIQKTRKARNRLVKRRRNK